MSITDPLQYSKISKALSISVPDWEYGLDRYIVRLSARLLPQ